MANIDNAAIADRWLVEVETMSVDLDALHVGDWMDAPLPAITPRTSISTALRVLREHGAPVLAVLDGARFVGLVDETSLLRFTPSEATTLDVYELRAALEKLAVARAARPVGEAVAPNTPLAAAVAAMSRACAQVMPVMEGGRLVGLLPWTRILAAASGQAASPNRNASGTAGAARRDV